MTNTKAFHFGPSALQMHCTTSRLYLAFVGHMPYK